jgi:ABC-type sugar transport system ATPase subunit
MTSTTAAPPVALSLRGIEKDFAGQRVLRCVDFDLRAGEVHALAGSNGSGKSTLMKVVYGAHRPTRGSLQVQGRLARFPSPAHALRAGIAAVPQELPLVPHLSVAENVFFGALPSRHRLVSWQRLEQRAAEVLARVDPEGRIPTSAEVARLNLASQQLVSIARALAHDAAVIVFDEPTSALGMRDVERLFEVIDSLRAQGRAIAFISQRLDDITEIADRVSVMRDGTIVAELPAHRTSPRELASLIVGHDVMAPGSSARPRDGPTVLELAGITTPRLRGLDARIGAGEVVGVFGLPGSGAEDVLPAVLGRVPKLSGSVRVRSHDVTKASLRRRIRRGIAYVSGDRGRDGLVRSQSVEFNLTMSNHGSIALTPLPQRRNKRRAEAIIEDLRIRPSDPSALVSTLSGGNQQKVVVGRWLLARPTVWLLDDPTRGVDVHSRDEIHALIRRQVMSDENCALMVSSDMRELLDACDRVIVVSRGVVVAEVDAASASEKELLALASGAALLAAAGPARGATDRSLEKRTS